MPPGGELLERSFSPGWRLTPDTERRCRLAVSLWRQAITVSSRFSVFLPSSCYS